jgi:beta-galactosidase
MVIASATLADESGRRSHPLDQPWLFHFGDTDISSIPDAAWTSVRLPHTWNGRDGEDGGGYERGVGWYKTKFIAPSADRRIWLEFDGAAIRTDVFVNGRSIGRHDGGYARFRFDITDALTPGENTLAVRVDSKPDAVAPLGGDFTIFGGLYRPVRLIETASIHIDLGDFGGPGVMMTATNVSDAFADISLQARISNDGDRTAQGLVRWRLLDASGAAALTLETPFEIAAGDVQTVEDTGRLIAPELWRGLADPRLYRLETTVLGKRGETLDSLTLTTGIRDFRIDPARGAILNGVATPMRGVNYFHAGRPGRGLAVQDWEIDQDFEIMHDMGSSGLRFVHFQHPQRAYDLADALGLMVWTEVPLNAVVDPSDAFSENLVQQMKELIRQNRHHPSVVIWGLGNEVYATDDPANAAIARMQAVAKAEDPQRPTAYAHCCQDDLDRKALHADLTAYNRYFGWYDETFARIGTWADERHARDPTRPMAVSEYGAGASILQQESHPARPRPDGDWHPEQYQTDFHQAYWRNLRERPWLWSNFVWVGFDLASDGRNEGDRPGINDKGLVSYDRSVRKDAWYWYQANWSATPMAHIVDRRMTTRSEPTTTIRAFSNQTTLGLKINGVVASTTQVVDHEAVWPKVTLQSGLNRIELTGNGETLDAIWLSH